MNRQELLIILQEETGSFEMQSRLRDDILDAMEKVQNEAINYSHCCTQLLCVDIDRSINMDITIGNKYKLIEEDRGNYIVINDKGIKSWYHKKFFEEIRKQ